ncbi:hypothetical protein ACFLT9_10915 [Acidobacteriota bacterium]
MKDQSERLAELANLLRPYEGKWVALPKEGNPIVIAEADSFSKLLTKLGSTNIYDLEFRKAPEIENRGGTLDPDSN